MGVQQTTCTAVGEVWLVCVCVCTSEVKGREEESACVNTRESAAAKRGKLAWLLCTFRKARVMRGEPWQSRIFCKRVRSARASSVCGDLLAVAAAVVAVTGGPVAVPTKLAYERTRKPLCWLRW